LNPSRYAAAKSVFTPQEDERVTVRHVDALVGQVAKVYASKRRTSGEEIPGNDLSRPQALGANVRTMRPA
jgi:hypothetical protein